MNQNALEKAWSEHSLLWEKNLWVYPVISRRAGGLSIGINLNPDKKCTFNCAYCQVDRTIPGSPQEINVNTIEAEIVRIFAAYEKNGLSDFALFRDVAPEKRRIKDICLSGDGESTLATSFAEICQMMRRLQDRYSRYLLQLTLITNATCLNRPNVQKGLEALTEKRGEIWAKLDAGSERWFQKIDRSRISLEQIQKNLESAVQKFPLRIQTMLCKIQNEFPDEEEIRLYIQRLQKIYVQNPSNFLGVQLYGVIRRTAIPEVLPLEKEFFEMVAQKIRETIPVHVAIF